MTLFYMTLKFKYWLKLHALYDFSSLSTLKFMICSSISNRLPFVFLLFYSHQPNFTRTLSDESEMLTVQFSVLFHCVLGVSFVCQI